MANTVSNKFDDTSDSARKNSSAGETEKKKSPAKKPEPKKGGAKEESQGSGWFGGIFSKLSMKPKNQMILPDDKDPSVSLTVDIRGLALALEPELALFVFFAWYRRWCSEKIPLAPALAPELALFIFLPGAGTGSLKKIFQGRRWRSKKILGAQKNPKSASAKR